MSSTFSPSGAAGTGNAPDGRKVAALARVRRFVAFTIAHRRLLAGLAAVVGIVGFVGTWRLYGRLESDLEALLPRNAPAVAAIAELRERLPGLQTLGVLVDTGTAENVPAAERLLDALAARVQRVGSGAIRSARVSSAAERTFIENNAPLYIDLSDLEAVQATLAARKAWEQRRATGLDLDLDDDPSPSPPPEADVDALVAELRRTYESRARAASGGEGKTAPDGRFSSRELRVSLLLLQLGSYSTGAERAKAIVDRVKAELAALGGPDAFAPGMRVRFTGEVAIAVEETQALEADLALSSILVVLAVMASLWLFFRWWPSVVVLLAPLGVATVATFALVQLPPFSIHELSSNTAFLGSIVIGNGINFGIILLARYMEERRAGRGVEDALAEAIIGSRRGTSIAAAAAGVSYASLLVTDFRGFNQFGLIGGFGMLLCWGAAYVFTPPLVWWLDSGARALQPRPDTGAAAALMAPLSRFVTNHARAVTAGVVVATVASVFAVRGLSTSRLESDFSKLRRRDTWVDGEGHWGRKMDALLGRYLSPTIVLADTREGAQAMAARIDAARAQPPLRDLVADVRTVDDLLPSDQQAKIATIERIGRLLTPAARAELAPEQLARVEAWLGGDRPLRPVTEEDLPPSFRDRLREKDGGLLRGVLVYPRPSRGLWQSETIFAYVDTLRSAAAISTERPGRVAGSLPLSADLVRSIARDGPVASVAALAGVVAIVVIMFRGRRESLLVLGALSLGVLWMTALVVALGVKINFTNFVAFPITFGIGVDYAVNVIARYLSDGRRDLRRAIRATGGAVGLCSVTTVIGYSSLLLAQNQALFLFGLCAVLGELTCLVAAVVALPAALQTWHAWRGRAGSAAATQKDAVAR